MKPSYQEIAKKVADLVDEKQIAYGDSFGKAGKIMEILYPDGIPIDQMDDALTIIRVLDKLFRIATKKDAFGENPWKDIVGYALLAVRRDLPEKLVIKSVKSESGFVMLFNQDAFDPNNYPPIGELVDERKQYGEETDKTEISKEQRKEAAKLGNYPDFRNYRN